MKSIVVNVEELLKKVQSLSDRHMPFVKISFVNETVDQNIYTPSFLHFEAYTQDGYPEDYESVDAVDYCHSGELAC